MNTIEALQLFISVLQFFGLSATRFSAFKFISIHRIIKYYSLLLIAARVCCALMFCHMPPNRKFDLYVDIISTDFTLFCDISALIEAFAKARLEEKFMENCLEIDNILIQHFGIDLKMNELRKSTVKRLLIWICLTGTLSIWLLVRHYNFKYFSYALIGILATFTLTLAFFQIITLTDLIRYRLHVLIRLINQLKYDHQREEIDANDDSQHFDEICILYDLYNRLWKQSNRLNERYKYTMLLSIANNFVRLVGVLYFCFKCWKKPKECGFSSSAIMSCLMNVFRLSMISTAGQNVVDESRKVAYALHRNGFIRSSIKLNSFVRCEYFQLLSAFQ